MRIVIVIGIFLLYACSPISKSALRKTFVASETKFNDHIGFALYDPEAKRMVFEYQSDRYFTPASNTKIFTFFAALKILGDSIPSFYYENRTDSLILWGSGDPGFLYKNTYHSSNAYDFLKNSPQKLFFSTSNFYTTSFGSGWAWDDYTSSYSPERSAFPIYGNILSVGYENRDLKITPKFFRRFVRTAEIKKDAEVTRDWHSNEIVFHPSPSTKRFKDDIPFKVDSLLIVSLLADTLHRDVHAVKKKLPLDAKKFFNTPSDSLYKVMMQESDNFIAEQLLLVCSSVLSDSLKPEITIEYVKKNYLQDLPDLPVWVDGSGLSRYNLFTPRSIVRLWEKIYTEIPKDRLFPLLGIGGKTGTLRNWYKNDNPYIFGKTGSLSNNHCVSGYLVTRSGKTLIFSFMNSNFTKPGNDVRNNMQQILKSIYDKY
jgi:D-alanyl-D-alanine carboxypeptidase/D-alanyl-D-alanine-endopeptidase (penicillin-binding protein 4)